MPGRSDVDLKLQQVAGQLDLLWYDVRQAGDEVARRTFGVEKMVKMGTSSSSLRSMLTVNEAVVAERYCPAKKLFVQAGSVSEFQKRAAKHCKEETPTERGISGAEVTLTTQCTQAYATPCP